MQGRTGFRTILSIFCDDKIKQDKNAVKILLDPFLKVHFNFIKGKHNNKSISDRHLVNCTPNRKRVIQYTANRIKGDR